MTPSWYDVLGVDPGAAAPEIRLRFKAEIADLDPTDRRFRLVSRAAEVLLDPVRRAAHDVELAEQADPEEDDTWALGATGDLAPVGVVSFSPMESSLDETRPVPVIDLTKGPEKSGEATASAKPASSPAASPSGRGPLRTAVVLAVLALVLVVATVVSFARGGNQSAGAASGGLPDARQVAAARAAAEAAIVPVLSYDFRQLDEDKAAAIGYLTPAYADEYAQYFGGVVGENSPTTRTVVQAKLLASGISRTGKGRVDVILFVDQATTNRRVTTPEIFKNQVIAQMVDQDGSWLVDCLVTTPEGGCDH